MEAVAALWTAVQTSQVFQVVSAVASVASAVGSYQAGREQARGLQMQAVQAGIQSRGEAVKYEQQANNVLRRSLEAQAAARARAAAGGVDPFSGSAQFIQDLSAKDGMDEFNLSRENAKLVALSGASQQGQYMQAARNARKSGLVQGLTSLGVAASRIGKIGGPTGTPAPQTTTGLAGVGLKPGGGLGLKPGGGLGLV